MATEHESTKEGAKPAEGMREDSGGNALPEWPAAEAERELTARAEKALARGAPSEAATWAQIAGQNHLAARALLYAGRPQQASAWAPTEDDEGAILRVRCLMAAGDGQGAEELLARWEGRWAGRESAAEASALAGAAKEGRGAKEGARGDHLAALKLDPLQGEALEAVSKRKVTGREDLQRAIAGGRSEGEWRATLSSALVGDLRAASLLPGRVRQVPAVRAAEAGSLLERGDPEKALERVRGLELAEGTGCEESLAALASLGRSAELMKLAHTLGRGPAASTSLPSSGEAGMLGAFAAGCQKLAAGRPGEASRWLGRACSETSPAAWLGFAHSLALQEEHDQALAAYRACLRRFPGWPLASLYLGAEHLAQQGMTAQAASAATPYLRRAAEADALDWQARAELGCAEHAAGNLEAADGLLRVAIELLPPGKPKACFGEVLHANLGHVLRAQGRLREALDELRVALSTGEDAKAPATHSCLGLTLLQLGRPSEAADSLHAALSLRPNDPLSAQLLHHALRLSSSALASSLLSSASRR